MRASLFIVLLLASLYLGAPALAATPADNRPCTAASAAATSIQAVQAKLEHWLGRCVRMQGIAAGNRLYASRIAIAEPIRPERRIPTSSIVIYPSGPGSRPARPARVEVLGRIGSCAEANAMIDQLSAERPGEIFMVTGFCHSSIEPFVEPSAVRLLDRSGVQRLTEAELVEAKRSLVAVPTRAGEPYLAAARALIDAVLSGDEAAFRRLAAPMTQLELDRLRGGPVPDWLREDLAEARSLFLDARKDRDAFAGLGEAKLFLAREELRESRPSEHFVCFCRSRNCAGRWPVTPFDADRDPARPYLCLRVHDVLPGPGQRTSIAVEGASSGPAFDEPVWDARDEGRTRT